MSRAPRTRVLLRGRHLICGCHVPAGTTVYRKPGRAWVCGTHQQWLEGKTIEQVLAEHRDRSD
jgi:hypothetical protein